MRMLTCRFASFAAWLAACVAASAMFPSLVLAQSPTISSVTVSGTAGDYTVTIDGSGFGAAPVSSGFVGNTTDLRIGDAAQIGHAEWGYSGDANVLDYNSWSNNQVIVSGLGASPGDALNIALWNPATGAGVTWGGNAPPTSSTTPQIASVQFFGSGQNTEMVVKGFGFGNSPLSGPTIGDLNDFGFADFRAHSSSGSALFAAGNAGWNVLAPAPVTLDYQSWSNNEIQIGGFGGAYGQGSAILEAGDPVALTVWNSGATGPTGPQTAWGGTIPSETAVPEPSGLLMLSTGVLLLIVLELGLSRFRIGRDRQGAVGRGLRLSRHAGKSIR